MIHGQIRSVTYDAGKDNGMPEVVIRFTGIAEPLILSDPEDADQTVHIYEYWSTLWEHADMLDDHGGFEDEDY
jgi:hypothetical protein